MRTPLLRPSVSEQETDFTEDLKKMTIPTLVVHGDDDQILPIHAAALRTVESAPQATLKVYQAPRTVCLLSAKIS